MNIIDTRLARASTILTEPTVRYDNVSVVLHWLTAALIILLWISRSHSRLSGRRIRQITLTKIRMWRCETHSERYAGSS